MDDLCLVEPVDGLCERIVVAVTETADGWLDTRFCKAFCVFDRDILAAPVTVMDKATTICRIAVMQGLFKGIQHKAWVFRTEPAT